LSGGYSSAWSADVNGEEKLKVENFFQRGVVGDDGECKQEHLLCELRALCGKAIFILVDVKQDF
jgi:hypothetical protein